MPRFAMLLVVPVLAVAFAGPASAHITVQPPSAAQGADDVSIAFRVPNEMDDATTTMVAVKFPTDTPLASVLVTPVAGWTAAVQTAKLATPIKTDDGDVTDVVSEITWTATGAGVPVGNFQDFGLSVGPIPAGVTSLGFPAVQTYSNGQVVSWIDPATDSSAEHPTPTLTLTGASSPASPGPSVTAVSSAPVTAKTTATSSSDGAARALGITGIAVGLLGVPTGLVLGRRRG